MMDALQQEGRFTAWGVSNWDLTRLQAAIAYAAANGKAGPICDSPQVSLAVPTRPVWPDTKFATVASRDFYAESGVAVLGWEVLAKGFMTGKWDRAPTATRAALSGHASSRTRSLRRPSGRSATRRPSGANCS